MLVKVPCFRVGALVLVLQAACTERLPASATDDATAQATPAGDPGSTADEPAVSNSGLLPTSGAADTSGATTGVPPSSTAAETTLEPVGTTDAETTDEATTSAPSDVDCGEVVLTNGRRFVCVNHRATTGRQLAAADFSGDGVADLAVLDFAETPIDEDHVHLLLGGPVLTSGVGFSFPAAGAGENQWLAGDLDGDAAPDLLSRGWFGELRPFWNDGGDVFVDEGPTELLPIFNYTLVDVAGLGHMQLVGGSFEGEPVIRAVGFDADRAVVVAPETAPVVTCTMETIVAARLDGDPFPDIVVAPYCNGPMDMTPVHTYRGTATTQFDLVEPGIPTGSSPGVLAAGDYDGDGDVDVVVGNQWVDNLMVLRGNGLGGLQPQPPIGVCSACTPNTLVTGDLGAPADSIVILVFDGEALINRLAVVLEPLSLAPTFDVLRSDAIPFVGRDGLAVGDFNGDAADDMAYILMDDTLVLLLSAL